MKGAAIDVKVELPGDQLPWPWLRQNFSVVINEGIMTRIKYITRGIISSRDRKRSNLTPSDRSSPTRNARTMEIEYFFECVFFESEIQDRIGDGSCGIFFSFDRESKLTSKNPVRTCIFHRTMNFYGKNKYYNFEKICGKSNRKFREKIMNFYWKKRYTLLRMIFSQTSQNDDLSEISISERESV